MFNAIGRIFRTPDLRRKLGFTLGIVALFRLGSFIPAPFVDFGNVQQCLAANQAAGASGLYDLVNLFSGGALLQLSIFALGIMPYITSSIILQLLTVVVPTLEKLQKEVRPPATRPPEEDYKISLNPDEEIPHEPIL